MVRFRLVLAAAFLALAIPAGAQKGQIPIIIETVAGKIVATLDSAHAPISVANFLKYVEAKHYDGGRFHRTDVVRKIQGGQANGQSLTPPITIIRIIRTR